MAVDIRPPAPPRRPKRGGWLGIFGSPEKAVLSDIKKTTSLLDKKERTLGDHEKALNALDAKSRQRERELRAYADKISGQEAEVQRKQKLVFDRELRVEKSEAIKAELIKEREGLEREVQKLNLKVLQLREEIDGIDKKGDDALRVIEQKKRDRILDMEKAIGTKRKELVACQYEIDKKFAAFKAEKLGLMKELDAATARRIADLEEKKETLIVSKQKELVGLQGSIDKRLAAFKAAKADAVKEVENAAYHRIADAESRKHKDIEQLDVILGSKRKELTTIQKDIDHKLEQFKREKTDVAKEMQAAAERRVADMMAKTGKDINALDDTLKTKQRELDALAAGKRKELAAIQKDIDAQLQQFKREKAALAKEAEASTAHKLAEMEAKKRKDLDDLDRMLATKFKELDVRLKEFKQEKEAALVAFDGKRQDKVAAMEAAIAVKRKELNTVQYDIDKQFTRFKANQAEVAKQFRQEKDAALVAFDAKKKEKLTDMDAALASKRKELTSVQYEVDKQLSKLKAAQSEVAKELKEQEKLKADVVKAQSVTEERLDVLLKKEQELEKVADEFEEKKKDLAAENAAKTKELAAENAAKKKELDNREKDIARKEIQLIKHADEMKNLRTQLRGDKEELTSFAAGKKAELMDVRGQWEEKLSQLQQIAKDIRGERSKAEAVVTKDLVAITDKEKTITQSVHELDLDNRRLKKEEDAIVRRVHDLDKAEVEYARMKKMFDHKVEEFAVRERDIREREDLVVRGMRDIESARAKVDAAWDKVRQVKEYKVNLGALMQKQKEFEDTVTKLSKKAIVLEHKQPLPEEKRPLPARKALVVVEKPAPKEQPKEVTHEPRELIADARRAFDAGDVAASQQLLSKAEKSVNKLKAGDEKRELSYDIWDLKTSIKLALVQ